MAELEADGFGNVDLQPYLLNIDAFEQAHNNLKVAVLDAAFSPSEQSLELVSNCFSAVIESVNVSFYVQNFYNKVGNEAVVDAAVSSIVSSTEDLAEFSEEFFGCLVPPATTSKPKEEAISSLLGLDPTEAEVTTANLCNDYSTVSGALIDQLTASQHIQEYLARQRRRAFIISELRGVGKIAAGTCVGILLADYVRGR